MIIESLRRIFALIKKNLLQYGKILKAGVLL